MTERSLDLSQFATRRALQEALAREFSFPDWYGHNLDALHDCLTALAQPTRLTLTGHFPEPRYEAALLRVLADAASENLGFTYQMR